MNREARIILPLLDNNGDPINQVHDLLRHKLCALFGGYTRTEVFGGWVHQGELFEEPGYAYDVAAPDNITSSGLLRGLAITIGQAADQKAMYVRYTSGDVEIVDIEAVTA